MANQNQQTPRRDSVSRKSQLTTKVEQRGNSREGPIDRGTYSSNRKREGSEQAKEAFMTSVARRKNLNDMSP